MPARPTSEKLDALAAALSSKDTGQVAVAADLLARLTENAESVRALCGHPRAEVLLSRCLELAACPECKGDVRADVLVVLKNVLCIQQGQALVAKDALLRPILETPPRELGRVLATSDEKGENNGGKAPGSGGAFTGIADSEEVATAVRQAWLGLALTAVASTCGGVLEGPRDLSCVQDAVFDLCDRGDRETCAEGFLLLRHIYGRRSALLGPQESMRLARLMRWGLREAVDCSDCAQNEALTHTLHLLAIVGSCSSFKAALFQVEEDDLESEQLEAGKIDTVREIVAGMFAAIHRGGFQDPMAWKAMSSVAEVKFVRRLMRVHKEVKGMFSCLLVAISVVDPNLTEQIVMFLKHIFTGATDQFLSTDTIMFDNLGRSEGIKKLLTALLRSWNDNADTVHRGNIVAFLADAMFFSSFTDAWQMHPQAKDLISILFDALLWKGVEGTAGLALGNFVSANGHIDLILDHERAGHSISNVGWFLKRTPPGWDTKMQVYYLWRVLRFRKGCVVLSQHPHADLVVAGLLRGVRHATVEDNEVLSLLEAFLRDDDTRGVVLRGANAGALLDGACELLTGGDTELHEPTCQLIQALFEATGPGALVTWPGAPRLIGVLSRISPGKDIVENVVQLLQWSPVLTRSVSLEFKREWLSNQIRSSAPGNAVTITVSRREVLKSLCEGLGNAKALQHGLQVKFACDDETGAGDGHRREFFRLAAEQLTALELGLFCSHDGGRTLHPSSTAPDVEPEFVTYFELLGKLIALALLHRETLPAARFTLALRKLLLNSGPLEVEDMAAVDPQFYRHKLLYIREARYEDSEPPVTLADLDLTFEDIPQPDIFPDARQELFPGGAQTPVTEENKGHYVELICDHRLRGSVSRQVEAMQRGLRSVIPDDVWCQVRRIVGPEELDLLICGLSEVDISDWKANSVCTDGVDEETWDTFWAVAEAFDAQQRKELLEFVTGSPGAPVGGFASLPGYGAVGSVQRFTVARNLQSSMPVASTCFNTLYLPSFQTEAEMRAALLEAIANRNAGGFYEAAVQQ